MSPETTQLLSQLVTLVVTAAFVAIGNEVRKYIAAHTDAVAAGAAQKVQAVALGTVAGATQLVGELVVKMAPDVLAALADGTIDEREKASLWAEGEGLMGAAGLDALSKATGLDTAGVRDWFLHKLEASAAAKSQGLPPFYASAEMSAKMRAGQVK